MAVTLDQLSKKVAALQGELDLLRSARPLRGPAGPPGARGVAGPAGPTGVSGLLAPAPPLSAAIAANAGKGMMIAPGTYALDASVTDTTTRLILQHGVVITVPSSMTLGSTIDWSAGGQIKPANGATVTLTGRQTMAPSHHAFDISLGGVVQIPCGAVAELTPENFGAKNDDVTDDTLALRAWLTCVEYDATANRCIKPRLLPGVGYLFGATQDTINVDWGGVTHYEHVALKVTKSSVVIESSRGCSLHWKPADLGLGDLHEYYGIRFRGTGSLVTVGIRGGALLRSGNSIDTPKTFLDFHDVRDTEYHDCYFNNTEDTSKRSRGVRVCGRDANRTPKIKGNVDLPIEFFFNFDDTQGRDANGIPLAYRDTKDIDHHDILGANLGANDDGGGAGKAANRWDAVVRFHPGVVLRNVMLRELAAVNGGIVLDDHLDSAPDAVESLASSEFTLTGHAYQTGDKVLFTTTGSLPSPLLTTRWYWLLKTGANTVKVCDDFSDALAGTFITLSGGSGTHTISGAAFRGALVQARRTSNNLSIVGGRQEGMSHVGEQHFAIRVDRHPSGPLRELFVEDYELGQGPDARRAVQTGASSLVGNAWSAIKARGVWNLGVGRNVNYGGMGVAIDADPTTRVSIDPSSPLVAIDNGILFPETADQYLFLGFPEAPRSWWRMGAAQDADEDDIQTATTDIDLSAQGTVKTTARQLRPGWNRYWQFFPNDGSAGERTRLQLTDTSLDPQAIPYALEGIIWPDTSFNPAGGEVFCNLSGTVDGPLLRTASSKAIEIHTAGGNVASSLLYWNDDQPFRFKLMVDPKGAGLVRVWLRKRDGQQETFTAPFVGSYGNDASKGFGTYNTAAVNPPRFWLGVGALWINDGARRDGFRQFDYYRWYGP